MARDAPPGLVVLRDDDRRDMVLRHQLRRAVDVGLRPDGERRGAHDAFYLPGDLLLAAGTGPVLLADLRLGEQLDDVLLTDDPSPVSVLVHDRDGSFPRGPYDLDRLIRPCGLRDR